VVSQVRQVSVVAANWWVVQVAPEPESLGQAIKRLRGSRKQHELAAAVGVGQNAVGKWETDMGAPSDDRIVALEAYFGLTPDTLFDIKIAHDKWERATRPVPGPSIAIPAEPEFLRIIDGLGALADDDAALAELASFLERAVRMRRGHGQDQRQRDLG
jgi:transcriptional regulator with XRE-family HTH domain